MDKQNDATNGNGSIFLGNNWWTRRTSLEKKLIASTLILIVISVAVTTISVTFYYEPNLIKAFLDNRKNVLDANVVRLHVLPTDKSNIKYSNKTEDRNNVCLTPTCVETAHIYLSNMDESISPCHDFYRFSCGKWLNNSVIPDNGVSISTTGAIVGLMQFQFKAMVEEPLKPEDPVFYRNVKNMYNSCMNLFHLAHLGDDPLIKVLSDLGGWPVARGPLWNVTHFDWIDTSIQMREKGLPFNEFYHLSVGLDIKDTTKHIITIGEIMPGVGNRQVMLKGLNHSDVRAYYQLLLESALLLGGKQSNPNLFKELMQLIDFQILIVNWTTPQEDTRDINKFYNKMTVRELQLMAPNTKWIKLLSGIFHQNIQMTDEVVVNNPIYVKQMDFMLKHTEKRILANHMMADVILTSLPLMSPKWLRLHYMYLHQLTGQKAVPPRWQICIKAAASLKIAFSAIYVRKHFKNKSKHKVEEMVNFIHQEFMKMLNKVDWMDSKTRMIALEKASSISSNIGFPQQLLNDTEIAKVYENLEELSVNQFFDNMLKLSKWLIDYSAKNLKRLRIKRDWQNFADAAVVNAYYNAIENAIIFPAGILQGLFFNYQNPDYVNFGAIGSVIAHEITHAFDDIGKQFDKDGNNKNWWDINTDLIFKSKAKCLIDQYNNYVVQENGLKVNGINTLGENIADNTGIREAFRAYKTFVEHNNKPQQSLPGLKYSPEQLFWITFGNIWCTRVRPEVFKMIIDMETHSPAEFRVTGSLSNLNEFAESFNCPEGSPMNPSNKCIVW